MEIELTTGEIGTGKTAVTVAGRLLEFLERAPGTLFYNVRLNLDGVREYLASVGRDPREADRIFVIPEDVHQSWRKGDDTPQKYFSRLSADRERWPHGALHNAAVVLDEVQKYWPSDSSAIGSGNPNVGRAARNEAQEFLSTIRQAGCVVIVMITQRRALVNRSVMALVTRIHELTNASKFKPWGLDIGALRQLVAKITGHYNQLVTEKVLVRGGEGEQWERVESRVHYLRSWMFTIYDSFSAHEINGVRSPVPRPLLAYERYRWPRFLVWFLGQNGLFLGLAALVVSFVVWLSSGGLNSAMNRAREAVSSTMAGGISSDSKKPRAAASSSSAQSFVAVSEDVPTSGGEKDRLIKSLREQNTILSNELRLIKPVGSDILFCNGVVGSSAIFEGQVYGVNDVLPDGRVIAVIDAARGRVVCRDGYSYSVSGHTRASRVATGASGGASSVPKSAK